MPFDVLSSRFRPLTRAEKEYRQLLEEIRSFQTDDNLYTAVVRACAHGKMMDPTSRRGVIHRLSPKPLRVHLRSTGC